MAESATPDIAIPSDILRKWQRIVDLLASIMKVPSAVVTTIGPPYASYTTIVSSASEGNPCPVDEIFSMDIGTFCETVIKKREPLLVSNAPEDDQWKKAPEIQVGMVSYLGFPVLWPDGRMFGTICVLDNKANRYSDLYQELLAHCRDVLEADLQMLVRLGDELESQYAGHCEIVRNFTPSAKAPLIVRRISDGTETMIDIHSPIARTVPIFGTSDPNVIVVDEQGVLTKIVPVRRRVRAGGDRGRDARGL